MQRKSVRSPSCPNPKCTFHGQFGKQNIVRHGFFTLERGKRRRYRCNACGKTFASTLAANAQHRCAAACRAPLELQRWIEFNAAAVAAAPPLAYHR